jgi:DNA-directed RNA polymerase subunit beta
MQIRNFGKAQTVLEIPDLVELQTRSYAEFLQALVPFNERKDVGLEAIIREIFPIKSYSGAMALEYIGYELGRPRYTPDECRKLRLTYGAPFKIRVRLDKEEPVEEEVYLGEIPIMLGGGEFIINGAERVIVTQLHRSPGVDFSVEVHAGERKLHSCWIIPERGSWIEVNVGKRDNLTVRIDQSGKFPCATLIRALDEKYTSDEAILKEFYATKEVKKSSRRFRKDITGKVPILDVVDEETGEILAEVGEPITEDRAELLATAAIQSVQIIQDLDDALILHSVRDDPTSTHEEALLKIYSASAPGQPAECSTRRASSSTRSSSTNALPPGRVGRFRLNRKFGLGVAEDQMTLAPEDFIHSGPLHDEAARGDGRARRHRPSGQPPRADDLELAGEEFRKGLLKLRRTAQERMTLERQRRREGHASQPDQQQDLLVGDRLLLRSRRAEPGRRPDEPAQPARARAPPLGSRSGRPQPQAGGLRGPRRPHRRTTAASARSRRPKAPTSA